MRSISSIAILGAPERAAFCARAASGATVPAVLEIPSKDAPYDATRDAVLSRAQRALVRGDEDEELRG